MQRQPRPALAGRLLAERRPARPRMTPAAPLDLRDSAGSVRVLASRAPSRAVPRTPPRRTRPPRAPGRSPRTGPPRGSAGPARSRPSTRPDSRPATAESPAPVGLPRTRGRRGRLPQAFGRWPRACPSAPSEATTVWAPRRRASRAARSGSREPVSPASSSALGLTRSGRAAMPRRSGSPLVSSSTGTFARAGLAHQLGVRARPAAPAAGCRTAPPRRRRRAAARTSPRKASHSAGETSGPGSLSWVVSPVAASTTAIVRRVAPAMGTSASTGAERRGEQRAQHLAARRRPRSPSPRSRGRARRAPGRR